MYQIQDLEYKVYTWTKYVALDKSTIQKGKNVYLNTKVVNYKEADENNNKGL